MRRFSGPMPSMGERAPPSTWYRPLEAGTFLDGRQIGRLFDDAQKRAVTARLAADLARAPFAEIETLLADGGLAA